MSNDCTQGNGMPDIWAIIVIVIILMVIYGYLSSKLSERRKSKDKGKSIPLITDNLKPSVNHNIHLSDGRKFLNVQIIGSVEGSDAEFSFAGWDGMLVLRDEGRKKIYVKKSSIRFVEEI